MDVDFSELDRLTADLGAVPDDAARFIAKALEVSATNIKDDWRDNAKGMAHAPAFPYSITYDLTENASLLRNALGGGGVNEFSAVIGPDKGRTQGALGNLIEFGSRNNPPMGLGHGALQREQAGFQRGVDKALSDAMEAHGL